MKTRLTLDEYASGILSGDRVVLGKAISLVESNLPSDQQEAARLIERIIGNTGSSIRLGITGIPGVGKSTFIEVFGKYLTDQGKKIAVLTVDPSSQLTKGSILGDKTRMEELSKNQRAFIRPTASGTTLGGVSSKTRETILLCEAAGFDVIIIETVGVGQSEVAVKSMVDFFLLLMLAGAGDELQGIKKGIMEMADAVVITKADGDNVKKATEAQAEYQHALHLFPSTTSGWQPKVLTSSSLTKNGIAETWALIQKYQQQTQASGFFDTQRAAQKTNWFQEYFQHLLLTDFHRFPEIRAERSALEKQVLDGELSVHAAGNKLITQYHTALKKNS